MGDRACFLPGVNDSTILDDRYNAAGDSTVAAIQLLREGGRRHIAILGDMFELGSEEEAEHRRVGEAAATLDQLILLGSKAEWIAEAARERGMEPEKIVHVDDNEQAIDAAKGMIEPGDVVLVKGSRGMQMEGIVAGLVKTPSETTTS